MINVDAIKELIDQAPEIKTLFTTWFQKRSPLPLLTMRN